MKNKIIVLGVEQMLLQFPWLKDFAPPISLANMELVFNRIEAEGKYALVSVMQSGTHIFREKDLNGLTEHEVWMEGFSATGQSGTAQLVGKYWSESFDDACKNVQGVDEKPYTTSPYYTVWGCRLFDNENDARASFG